MLPRLTFALFTAAALLTAQTGGSISGTVVSATTGEPLRGVEIQLMGRYALARVSYSGQTDSSGKYAFHNVAPDTYRISATRPGYVATEYGDAGPASRGAALPLAAGQTLAALDIRMQPTAVISGQVLDETGEPLPRVSVEVLRTTYLDGEARRSPAGSATTDDRGFYRAFDLPPGRYHVRALSRDAGRLALPGAPFELHGEIYLPVYYPSGPDITRAESIDVPAGAEVSGINLTMLKGRTYRIRAHTVRPAGATEPVNGMVIPAGDAAADLTIMGRRLARGSTDGIIEVAGLTPGRYRVLAGTNVKGVPYTGETHVEIAGSDIEGIAIPLKPAFRVTGRIEVEKGAEVSLAELRVRLRSGDGPVTTLSLAGVRTPLAVSGNAPVSIDGTFAIDNVPHGRAFPQVYPLPDGVYVKSVHLGERTMAGAWLDLAEDAGELRLVLGAGQARKD